MAPPHNANRPPGAGQAAGASWKRDRTIDSTPASRPQAATRIPVELTRPYGVEELHGVYLQHYADRGGPCSAVGIQIPECSRATVRGGLALARKYRARLQIISDAASQARRARRLAERLCPEHRFVALERAEAGGWGLAS